MALTLSEAKVGMADHVDQMVIDEFRRSSLLLDSLTFDDTVSPGTGGSTLVYGYQRLLTPSTVKVRKINEEYTPGEAKRKEYTAKVIPFGGSFQLDRVVIDTAGEIDELNFQIQQKVAAASNYFHYVAINGTSASSGAGYVTDTFDGLNKMLTGTDTAVETEIDLSTPEALDANYNAFLDEIDDFLSMLDGKPDMLIMNSKMKTKMKAVARRAGYYSRSEDAFGRSVDLYDGIALMDAGKYYDGSKTIDVVATTDNTSAAGTTGIYAVTFGLDAFHGISVDGSKMVSTFLPDMSQPGAVKEGEVEMLAGVVLKNSRKAGMLTGIKVTPQAA